jgi:hypothetical protein
MRSVTKSFAAAAATTWGPWAPVRFQTAGARDQFLLSVAESADSGWAAQAMLGDGRGARVRWRPGSFLRLNDVAYAHGGRIVIQVTWTPH